MYIPLKVYTWEDVVELRTWFEQHAAEIPDSLEVHPSTIYPDLKQSISNLIGMAEDNWERATFAGYIRRLEEIRQKLLEDQA